MDENTVEFPILTWTDPTPYPNIDTMGLSALGSAVFYRYMCSLGSSFPDGVCLVDDDCEHLANTECKPRTIGLADTASFQSCQCRAGYQVIPSKFGTISMVFTFGSFKILLSTSFN